MSDVLQELSSFKQTTAGYLKMAYSAPLLFQLSVTASTLVWTMSTFSLLLLVVPVGSDDCSWCGSLIRSVLQWSLVTADCKQFIHHCLKLHKCSACSLSCICICMYFKTGDRRQFYGWTMIASVHLKLNVNKEQPWPLAIFSALKLWET